MSLEPNAAAGLRVIRLRGLEVQARLGIYPHEEAATQRVVIGVELSVMDEAAPDGVGADEPGRVLNYERVVQTARSLAMAGHVLLAETLAERIAVALLKDLRVRRVRVSVDKPEVFADVGSIGVVVERARSSTESH